MRPDRWSKQKCWVTCISKFSRLSWFSRFIHHGLAARKITYVISRAQNERLYVVASAGIKRSLSGPSGTEHKTGTMAYFKVAVSALMEWQPHLATWWCLTFCLRWWDWVQFDAYLRRSWELPFATGQGAGVTTDHQLVHGGQTVNRLIHAPYRE
jgi:hypothetical protein